MKLNFSKWFINSMVKPLDFLGYRINASYKLIRKDSVVRAKRKIRSGKKTLVHFCFDSFFGWLFLFPLPFLSLWSSIKILSKSFIPVFIRRKTTNEPREI